MWWLERQSSEIRRVIPVAEPPPRGAVTPDMGERNRDSQDTETRDTNTRDTNTWATAPPPTVRHKPPRAAHARVRREKLLDTLTDAQREANQSISQDVCGYEVEIAQLKRDVKSLEATVRSKTESLVQASERFESERERLRQFIVGHEFHVAACETELAAVHADRDAKLTEMRSELAAARSESAKSFRHAEHDHAAILRLRQQDFDRTIDAMKNEIHSLTESHHTLQSTLQSTLEQTTDRLRDAETQRQDLVNQHQSERSRWQIDHDIAEARLEKMHREVAEAWSISQTAADRLQRHEATLQKMRDREQRLIEVHQSQIESMQQEIDQRDAALESMQSTIEDLNATVDQERQNRVRVGNETAKLKAQLASGRARGGMLIQQYQDRLSEAEDTIARYHEQLQSTGNRRAA